MQEDQPDSSRAGYVPGDHPLQDVSNNDNEWLTELDLIFYAYQIARGMDFLSARGVS